MMIFQETYAQVLRGEKNETRRLVKPGDEIRMEYTPTSSGPVKRLYRNGKLRWSVFGEYAVQPGRGQKGQHKILILSIRRERLQAIQHNAKSVRDEGFATLGDFIAAWDRLNPKHPWASNPDVWVIRFVRPLWAREEMAREAGAVGEGG